MIFKEFKKRMQTFKKVLGYLGKFKSLFILSIILTILAVAMTLYIPLLVGTAIDLAVGINNVNVDEIAKILFKILVLILTTAIFQWLVNIINNKIAFLISKRIRTDAFAKLQKVPVSYIDSHRVGDVVSRVINDVDIFSDGLLIGLTQFFNALFTILGTLVFMLLLSPPIALVIVLLTPISLFVAAFIAKRTFSMFKLQSKIRSEQTSLVDEAISQHKTVLAFSMQPKMIEDFEVINDNLSKASLKAIFFSSITNPSTRFVNSLIYSTVALIGALTFLSAGGINITIGVFSSFLTYANQYTKPFNEISGVITELQNSLACAERIFELINESTELKDSDTCAPAENICGNVQFENVSFSYTKDKKLITDFNFSASSGQHIAIVGPTGCGKTTLINLLMRFYDVDSGRILLDGVDIRDYKRNDLRDKFGMVLQDTWLMPGTIRENIAFGNKNATDEEIVNVAKAVHAHSFIRRLPNGYDTVIDENSSQLSAGQRQLLCIARVMLSLPDILILDEATSSIDTRTEIKIQKAFELLMKGKTSFIVAHRLSTIKEADVILVMKDGTVIEKGTHTDLLAQDGFYKKLFYSQFPQTNQ